MTKGILDQTEYLRTVLDAIPLAALVVDADMRIFDANAAASHLLGNELPNNLRCQCGEALKCVHALNSPDGCGTTAYCTECICRKSAETALTNLAVTRQKCHMTILENDKLCEIYYNVTAAPFIFHEDRLVLLLLEDITELTLLRKIIPICMHCKRIRNPDNSWESIEGYLLRNNHLALSHGICAECKEKYYSNF
jgi:PAS domain-containing protein